MIKPYKNRSFDPIAPVRVHRNLHSKCYSICQKGKVVGHATHLALRNCYFVVRKAGQQRVRRMKEKNVHAFVEGNIVWDNNIFGYKPEDEYAFPVKITYNPYTDDTFMAGGTTEKFPIEYSKYVMINSKGVTTTFQAKILTQTNG